MLCKVVEAAKAASTKLKAVHKLAVKCQYLGQSAEANGGYMPAPALWKPPLVCGRPEHTHTMLHFRFSLRIAGETVRETVSVRYDVAATSCRGVPLPPLFIMVRKADLQFPRIAERSIELALRHFPRGSAVTCDIIGVPKPRQDMPDAAGHYPGEVVKCVGDSSKVMECMLAAPIMQTGAWLCASDQGAWQAVHSHVDCGECLVERNIVVDSDGSNAMEPVRKRIRNTHMLRGIAATMPHDTETILALAAWHAEVLRANRASLPNHEGVCFPRESIGTARFEPKVWRWPESMRHCRVPVWSLWSVRATRDTPMWGACYFLGCSLWYKMFERNLIPVPCSMRGHTPHRYGTFRPSAPQCNTMDNAMEVAQGSGEGDADESSAESELRCSSVHAGEAAPIPRPATMPRIADEAMEDDVGSLEVDTDEPLENEVWSSEGCRTESSD